MTRLLFSWFCPLKASWKTLTLQESLFASTLRQNERHILRSYLRQSRNWNIPTVISETRFLQRAVKKASADHQSAHDGCRAQSTYKSPNHPDRWRAFHQSLSNLHCIDCKHEYLNTSHTIIQHSINMGYSTKETGASHRSSQLGDNRSHGPNAPGSTANQEIRKSSSHAGLPKSSADDRAHQSPGNDYTSDTKTNRDRRANSAAASCPHQPDGYRDSKDTETREQDDTDDEFIFDDTFYPPDPRDPQPPVRPRTRMIEDDEKPSARIINVWPRGTTGGHVHADWYKN